MNLENSRKTITEYPEIMNARDIAEYMGIGYTKTLSLLKYGKIPAIRLGNTFKICRNSFENWLKAAGNNGNQPVTE